MLIVSTGHTFGPSQDHHPSDPHSHYNVQFSNANPPQNDAAQYPAATPYQQSSFPPSNQGIDLHHPISQFPPPAASSSRFQQAPRRTTVQKIKTQNGNLVVELPVPNRYLELCGRTDGREFTHLRQVPPEYTAVTCDPDQFCRPEAGYNLRPRMFGRDTELFIVITMYNEDDVLFAKSMCSVMKNIAYLCSDKCRKSWGPNGWTNVVVCIVADGRTKCHPQVLKLLTLMGCYNEAAIDIAKAVNQKNPTTAHLFEFTTQIVVDRDMRIRSHRDGLVPVQVLFCLKEKNAKKINSHRWFFNAFGPVIKPNVCVLLDVGTKPTGRSIYYLWREFDRNKHVGGACGEIRAEGGKGCSNFLNPLVASQNFEYKMSNILDKPLESVFGYIQVLPGAFSAYRYSALQNSSPNTGPLASYFRGEALHSEAADVFSANMYLAEDRILCFELVTKRNEAWLLRYCKSASAETDVPSSLPELVSQRRRWLNGSFFAAVHSITNYPMFFRSNHSILRKLIFTFQTLYNIINVIFSWITIGSFYLTFYFLFEGVYYSDPFAGHGPVIFQVVTQVYLAAIVIQFISSFGNRPQGFKLLYYALLVIWSIIMGFLLFMAGYTVYVVIPKTLDEWRDIGSLINQPTFRDLVISLASTYGLYFVASFLYLDPWHMFTSMVSYLVLLPMYVNIFMIYAFCNLHDISWGTKGDNGPGGSSGPSVPLQVKGPDVTVEVPMPDETPEEMDKNYARLMEDLNRPQERVAAKVDAKTKNEDYFRLYRTNVVLAWMLTNVVLVIIFTTPAITDLMVRSNRGASPVRRTMNPYLTFLFWSVTGLAAIRFLGSILYLLSWIGNLAWDLCCIRNKRFTPRASRASRVSINPNAPPGDRYLICDADDVMRGRPSANSVCIQTRGPANASASISGLTPSFHANDPRPHDSATSHLVLEDIPIHTHHGIQGLAGHFSTAVAVKEA
ncbi:chitin synthase 1 [Polychytrium aggregatum]|uniref:chitin synthase 1 n=1 Tax=Polychytrium aggregatum TaxID=110093 RepID=UPI0022FEC23C|nr:chitin synthase 1 [Polychytrium aggregatum]KAI9206504.1 chitin synthase 1 [Polychytrium aggregatum]